MARIWSSWKRGLAEGGFGPGAADARGWVEAVGVEDRLEAGDGAVGGLQAGEEFGGFGVVAVELEGGLDSRMAPAMSLRLRRATARLKW